ncbi:hypothetical protein ACPTHO_13955, partial [Enterococcus faecalis]
LNSLEYIANQLCQSLVGETTVFDKIEVIECFQLADVRQVAETFIREDGLSRFYMYPKRETEQKTNCLTKTKIFEIFQFC